MLAGVTGFWMGAFLLLDALFPVTLEYQPRACVVLSRDHIPLRAFADENGIWRYPIRIKEVSTKYIEALIGYEDRFFYSHPGVNPLSLGRALFQYIKYGRIISGGSTLTMQTARLIRKAPRTLPGKFIQILTAFQLEYHFSKDQILNYYLNHAPFGGVHQGVQAASFAYFEHGARHLTHAQAALLAVMPQAPTRLRPDLHPNAAQAARDKLLNRLAKYKIWPEDVVRQARKENITGWPVSPPTAAPLLSRRLFLKHRNEKGVIHTFTDHALQLSLEQLARDYASELPPRLSLSVLVMDNNSGGVMAYVGSADFTNDRRFAHVDMVTAMRSPGSTLKPFIYGLALDRGLIHSESLLMDIPIEFADYRPLNFNRRFTGPVSVSSALSQSLNLPAVQLLDHLDPMYFYTRMIETGFELRLPQNARPNLSLALGGFATSLENLLMVYSSLGRGGKTIAPRYETGSKRVENTLLSEGAAWIVYDILRSDADKHLVPGMGQPAVKTGTSYGFRDAWAIGVDKTFTAGVWVGRPDGLPVQGFFGAKTAEPLLKMVFQMLPRHDGKVEKPESVTRAQISWPGGLRAKSAGPQQQKTGPTAEMIRSAWLLNDTAPKTLTQRHDITGFAARRIKFCRTPDRKYRIPETCKNKIPCTMSTLELWPAGLEQFLPKDLQRSSLIPPVHPDCSGSDDILVKETIKIKGLADNEAIIRKSDTHPYPAFDLEVSGGYGPWFWFVNSELKASGATCSFAPKRPGIYQILVIDKSGYLDQIQVEVF